jgi:D-glycero-alpha-D-manno-heptose-7-phosphate kinase
LFLAPDRNSDFEVESKPRLDTLEPLILHKGVYNRIVADYRGGEPLSFTMSTSCDAPAGSGIGSSSTVVVAIIEAYNKWLNLNLTSYEKARLAYRIEREDLGLSGGKQDQYSAVFGGFNLMEFKESGAVIVNPLKMDRCIVNELECSLLMVYSGRSRDSALIIDQQISNTQKKDGGSIEAMHRLKADAYRMKDSLLTADIGLFARLLREGWEYKKKTAGVITNPALEKLIAFLYENGAEAVKVSGAGGGGFVMTVCNPESRQRLLNALKENNILTYPVKFAECGAESWAFS